MNCDTAFDLMTDLHGSRSGALSEHFESCPRCRRMQEALSPALEFLAEDGLYKFSGTGNADLSGFAGAREPFVTTEAVQVARQAAAGLASRAEMPRARLTLLAGRTAKYAAAFAAGLVLAVILFNQRDRSVTPTGSSCTRREASTDNPSRTPDQIQALAQSCAVCHQSPAARNGDHSMLAPTRGDGSWDWLLRILEEQSESTVESPRFDNVQMIAGASSHARPNREQA